MLDVVKEEEFSTRETGDDLVSSFLLLKNDPLHSCFKFQAPPLSSPNISLGNRAGLPLCLPNII